VCALINTVPTTSLAFVRPIVCVGRGSWSCVSQPACLSLGMLLPSGCGLVAGVQYSYASFHVMFVLAACYIAMLVTRWGETQDTDDSLQITDSMTSVWLKITLGGWASFGLYALLMLLPPMCPSRDFK
jgi:hypothetical protein